MAAHYKRQYWKHADVKRKAAKERYYKSNRPRENSWRRQGIEITISQYEALLQKQGGVCAVCGKPPLKKKLAVDHDHLTGENRGLVHNIPCNFVLGLVHDEPALLRKAADYLESYGRRESL